MNLHEKGNIINQSDNNWNWFHCILCHLVYLIFPQYNNSQTHITIQMAY